MEEGNKRKTRQILLDERSVHSICEVLAINNIEEKTIGKISDIIAIFCLEKHNLKLFIEELKHLICTISKQINSILTLNMKEIKRVYKSVFNRDIYAQPDQK